MSVHVLPRVVVPVLVAAPVRTYYSLRLAALLAYTADHPTFGFVIEGTSMNQAGINHGDHVGVVRNWEPLNGDIVAVWPHGPKIDAIPLIKRLIVTASGERWITSESANPKFGAYRLGPGSSIIGVVVGVRSPGETERWRYFRPNKLRKVAEG